MVTPFTDSLKIQIIMDNRKLKKEWAKCNSEQKHKVLEGLDIATDLKWILSLFTDILDN